MSKLLTKRYDELNGELAAVFATEYHEECEYSSGHMVNDHKYMNWVLKAKNLVAKSCGKDSLHFQRFDELDSVSICSTNYEQLLKLQAIFEAARDDFEGGYCNSVRTLVQAEVFDSELEQAKSLLISGYLSAAAVIAGVVLETALRQLCDNHNLPHGKLDKMNADLAKVGQYTVLKQKQITALADIRNSAAHGKSDNFSEDDVVDMINKISSFLADQLG